MIVKRLEINPSAWPANRATIQKRGARAVAVNSGLPSEKKPPCLMRPPEQTLKTARSRPDLIRSLLGVLVRFRQGRVAVSADIKEMFLRVKIRKEDHSLTARNNATKSTRVPNDVTDLPPYRLVLRSEKSQRLRI
ncbi:hypothetical protein EVAR_11570_1 [Eumeta japonica]|uniref:Uncharacterized protein n=1 Tax=Eumeta variegata TaxID=151549 RepID=A0A4C1X5Z3_EUMVA|nr:hypothetical protein EVAR_11570_1 [Eumeta japonica]